MKKKYTQEEQDAAWRKYRMQRTLLPIAVLAIAGLYFLGKSGMKKYRDGQAKEIFEQRVTKLIKTPTKDSYFILNNRYKDMSLKPYASNKDSISFDIGKDTNENFSMEMVDIFNSCKNSTQKVTIAKSDLLKSRCKGMQASTEECPAIPIPGQDTPFRVKSAFDFNGVNLKISMGWNINETKEKEITLINKGLPIQIKEIRSTYGDIKQLSKKLPAQINPNSRISMVVPIKKRFLPNRNYYRHNPHDFEILVETEKNGEELYRVTWENGNLVVNSRHLITN